jgi:predicted nucleic acid-binding Zn ribbon protein
MDAGIYPYDAQVVQRVGRRMQVVSYLIIILLTLVVVLSMQL